MSDDVDVVEEAERETEETTENIDVLSEDENARNRGVVEALLITADNPLGASKLSSVLGRQVGAKEVRAYVDALNDEYATTGRSFRITEVAGGFQLMIHPEFAPWIRQLMREKIPPRLSAASLETLAILAFKQPITKAEVEHIRGVAVDGVLRQLMEKSIVRIAGRSEAPGRPLLYGTTRDFLKHFGLKTLSDLPKLRELEELLKEEEQRIVQGEDSPLAGMVDTPETDTDVLPEVDGGVSEASEASDDKTEDAPENVQVDLQDTPDDDAGEETETDGDGTSESLSGSGGSGFSPSE